MNYIPITTLHALSLIMTALLFGIPDTIALYEIPVYSNQACASTHWNQTNDLLPWQQQREDKRETTFGIAKLQYFFFLSPCRIFIVKCNVFRPMSTQVKIMHLFLCILLFRNRIFLSISPDVTYSLFFKCILLHLPFYWLVVFYY